VWAAQRLAKGRERLDRLVGAYAASGLLVVGILILLGMALAGPLLTFSKSTPLQPYGAFSSRADVKAMEWLAQNTPLDTRILNHPGPHEGDWAPVITQRDTVYFRPQPFFDGMGEAEAAQDELLAFWRDPADPANAALLASHGVDYVLVPQIISRPEALAEMYRWRPPLVDESANHAVSAAPFLELMFDDDGAQVWRVVEPE
jgi:hypothetical protein